MNRGGYPPHFLRKKRKLDSDHVEHQHTKHEKVCYERHDNKQCKTNESNLPVDSKQYANYCRGSFSAVKIHIKREVMPNHGAAPARNKSKAIMSPGSPAFSAKYRASKTATAPFPISIAATSAPNFFPRTMVAFEAPAFFTPVSFKLTPDIFCATTDPCRQPTAYPQRKNAYNPQPHIKFLLK